MLGFTATNLLTNCSECHTVNILGVLLDDNLPWTPHIVYGRKKVLQTFYALKRIGQLVDRKTDSNPTSAGLLQHSLDEWPSMPYKANTNCTE